MKLAFCLALLFFMSPAPALELKAQEFFVCIRKKATSIEARSIALYKQQNKCVALYSVEGQDRVISTGRRFSVCAKKAKELLKELQKSLWECEKQKGIQSFYSS